MLSTKCDRHNWQWLTVNRHCRTDTDDLTVDTVTYWPAAAQTLPLGEIKAPTRRLSSAEGGRIETPNAQSWTMRRGFPLHTTLRSCRSSPAGRIPDQKRILAYFEGHRTLLLHLCWMFWVRHTVFYVIFGGKAKVGANCPHYAKVKPPLRRRKRQCTAWMDNIKTWTGLPVEDSIKMTEDRDKWRMYVHGVDNPRI